MSGFVGWIDFRRDLVAHTQVVRAMARTLQQGSDDEGTWVSPEAGLGLCRAVGENPRAKGPLLLETGAEPVVGVHIGSIDNLPALRRELEGAGQRLRTASDTEVVLRAYLHWGTPFVERLDGSFAFAIWDARQGSVLLGRDRFGVKPLYYHELPDGLLFASQPKAILACPSFEARLDLTRMPLVLQPRLALPGETPLAGLYEVRPAHTILYTRRGLESRRFWSLQSEPHGASFDQTAGRIRELLEDVVARQSAGTVVPGAMLSGGVDSTSIAALTMKVLRQRESAEVLDTFCVQFDSDSQHFVSTELRPDIDAPYAARAAEFIGSRHRTVTAGMHDLFDAIPQTRRARDLPGWGQFDASMYVLFREMRRHCSVALTGEAADEFFGGYPYFFKPELVQREGFPWLGDAPKLSDHLSPAVLERVDPADDERARYSQLISDVPRLPGEEPHEARMREILYLGMSGPLSVILDRKERMSTALGLEVRVPFCDHRLVEYVWNVPWAFKSRGGVKGLLKAAMGELLPPSTVERKKSAYPHVQNPRYDRAVIHEARRLVNEKGSPIVDLFEARGINELISSLEARGAGTPDQSFPGGANPAYLLIHVVELARWIESYGISLR